MHATNPEPQDAEFSDLYAAFHSPIVGYIAGRLGSSAEAEDVAAEVFVSALRAYRGQQREIHFRPWIYAIARNACIDHHRSVRRRPPPVLLDEAMASAGRDAHSVWESNGRFAQLRAALAGLPPLDQELIVQRELGGLSYAELAERTGLTAAAVETGLFRARRRLLARFSLLSGERVESPASPARPRGQRAA